MPPEEVFTATASPDALSGEPSLDVATTAGVNGAQTSFPTSHLAQTLDPSAAAFAAAAAAAAAPIHPPEPKRQICFDFTKNQCSRGHTCKFSHDLEHIIEVNSQEKGICFDFLKGTCARGPLCRFSHDLRNIHIAQAAGIVPIPPPARPAAPICYDFVKNQCNRGDGCRYSHDYASILLGPRPPGKNPYVMCMDFVRGKCSRGAGCRYAHGAVAPHPGMVAHAAASGAGAAAAMAMAAQMTTPMALAQAHAQAQAAAVAAAVPMAMAMGSPVGGLQEENLAAASLALQMQQLGLVSPAAAANAVAVSNPTFPSAAAPPAAPPAPTNAAAVAGQGSASEVSTLTALLLQQQQQQQQAAVAAAALRRLPSDLTDLESSIGSGGSTPMAAATQHAQRAFSFQEDTGTAPAGAPVSGVPPQQPWVVSFHHPLLAKVKAADALSSGLAPAGSSGSLGSAGSHYMPRVGSAAGSSAAHSISGGGGGGADSPTIRAAWGEASGGVSTAASSQPASLSGSPGGGDGLLLQAHRPGVSRLGSSLSEDRTGLDALKSIWSRS